MITIEHVDVLLQGKQILSDINLHIDKGEFVLLCGESGCGKTTLTKLINGLIPHFVQEAEMTGHVTVAGKDVVTTKLYELASLVGSVFQNPKTQFFHTNSNAEMAFGLENEGKSPAFIRERVQTVIDELQIGHLADRNVFMMSGGEKQLLAFASVYAMNPEVYVLDEPSANLDMAGIDKLRKRVEMIKQQGKTIIVAEHRLAYLLPFADRVIYMRDGKIAEEYTKEAFEKLPEDVRKCMGLRSLVLEEVRVPNRTMRAEEREKSTSDVMEESVGGKPNDAASGETDALISDETQKSGIGSIDARENMLMVQNLTCVRSKKTILQDVTFVAKPGDILGVIGRNGAGKSTLCQCICGLLKMKSGEIRYNDTKLGRRARTRLCAMVMQDVNHQLFSDSVKNECLLANEDAADAEIESLLKRFDLELYADRHPMTLSGGQRQRLAICQAIMGGKKLLVFDEPTSGLDYRHMCQVGDMLKLLAGEGYSILVVTHDYEFLNRVCTGYIEVGGAKK